MLEQEFRELAERLSEDQWQTSQYRELIGHLDESEESDLLEYLDRRYHQLELSLDSYRNHQILPEEVTEETLAGHRLLEEGIQGWLEGIGILLTEIPRAGDCEPALERIERSNRLLVSVQRLHQRVSAQTARPGKAELWFPMQN